MHGKSMDYWRRRLLEQDRHLEEVLKIAHEWQTGQAVDLISKSDLGTAVAKAVELISSTSRPATSVESEPVAIDSDSVPGELVWAVFSNNPNTAFRNKDIRKKTGLTSLQISGIITTLKVRNIREVTMPGTGKYWKLIPGTQMPHFRKKFTHGIRKDVIECMTKYGDPVQRYLLDFGAIHNHTGHSLQQISKVLRKSDDASLERPYRAWFCFTQSYIEKSPDLQDHSDMPGSENLFQESTPWAQAKLLD
jgi:hypothetical protein